MPISIHEVEIWKPIPGFSDYAASTLGRIKRLAAGRNAHAGRIRKPSLTAGYLSVKLTQTTPTQYVHILVARTFLGACPAGMEVNHKDFDRKNARLENLEYVSHHENVLHAWAGGALKAPPVLRGEDNPKSKISLLIAKQVRNEYVRGVVTQQSLAEKYGLDQTTISQITRGKTWRAECR